MNESMDIPQMIETLRQAMAELRSLKALIERQNERIVLLQTETVLLQACLDNANAKILRARQSALAPFLGLRMQ